MWRDLQYSFRQAGKRRLFSAVIIVLLAVGIGANTLIFGFVDTLLLKPLPIQDPGNLFLLERVRVKQVRPDPDFPYVAFQLAAKKKNVFTSVVAEQVWDDSSFQPLAHGDRVRLVTTQIVSPNYFAGLGVHPAFGRALNEADSTATSDIPVVIGYPFWRSQFNGDAKAIGSRLRVKGYPYSIVGILPAGFHGLDIERDPNIRLPISAAITLLGHQVTEPYQDRMLGFQILARLAPGVSKTAAALALAPELKSTDEFLVQYVNGRSLHPHSADELNDEMRFAIDYRPELQPVARGFSLLRDQFSHALTLLMCAVALLWVAVCANVTGLLLARSAERQGEIAVRLSMGASRFRIMRQLLIENLLLAIPGAALGLGFAYAGSPLLIQLLPVARQMGGYATQRSLRFTTGSDSLLFAAALGLTSLLAFGVLPALQGTRFDLNFELKGVSRSLTQTSAGLAPVAIQVCLSMLLLAAAIMMFRTYWNLEHLDAGFDKAHVIEFTTDPDIAGYSGAKADAFFDGFREHVASLPGVRAAAYAHSGLMRGVGMKTTVTARGVTLPVKTFLNTSMNSVSDSYFDAMGIPILRGRKLALPDEGVMPHPIVVNEAFAKSFFSGQNAVGKAIVEGVDGMKAPTFVIVGVCGTAKYRSLRESNPPTFYSIQPKGNRGDVLYVRTYGDPANIIHFVQAELQRMDSAVPLVEVFTLEQEVQNSLWQERLVATLSAFFGVTALLLSAIGLYGVLAFSVARRARELGIRIAVGARARHILRTVCGRLMLSVGVGLSVGIVMTVILIRSAGSLLYGVDPIDIPALAGAASLLLLCCIVAAAVPSWRAARIDPVAALREG